MAFAEERVSYDDTRKRSSTQYVKFTPDYRIVLRMLDTKAIAVWKHWIGQANGGKGMAAVCPGIDVCPIDKALQGLPKDDPKVVERKARKRYIVNVLDRTPVTVCDSCQTQTPAVAKGAQKVCNSCGADVKKNTFVPLNKVKILEGGPQLFLQTLNPVEDIGLSEWETDITGYDITFQTQGVGRDRKIAAVPQSPSELSEDDFLDAETGEPQKLFDLELLSEPTSSEEIELMLQGGTMADLNALRGVA